MARVLTNNTGLRAVVETSLGVPPTSDWFAVEFDSIGAYGATITTVVRRPIGQDRGRQKGAVVDLESTVEYETDLTIDAFIRFAEGFMFAEYTNVEFNLRSGVLPPPAVATTDDFTIDSVSALLAGKAQFNATGGTTILFAKGYTNAANNGLHLLNVDMAATDTTAQVATTLVAETPPTNATLEICGIRAADDFVLVIDGGLVTGTLASAADVDFTTIGLTLGQECCLGSPLTATGAATNVPSISGVDQAIYFRLTAITATLLTFNKVVIAEAGVVITAGTSPGSEVVDFMFGRFARNVPVTNNTDDDRYLERTYQFEAVYPDLGGVSTDEYEYAIGNFVNEYVFNIPLAEKATLGVNFIGTNSDDITGSRKTGPSVAPAALRKTAFGTGSNILSISTDVVSAVSDVCFKSLTLSILNNVSPEKCLGTLGATFVNAGLFEANLEGQMLFTNKSIVNAIKNNTTVTFQSILRNGDGAICIDMPELTLGGGGREYPVDQSVLINITGESFTSNTFGYDIGFSHFAAVPGIIDS